MAFLIPNLPSLCHESVFLSTLVLLREFLFGFLEIAQIVHHIEILVLRISVDAGPPVTVSGIAVPVRLHPSRNDTARKQITVCTKIAWPTDLRLDGLLISRGCYRVINLEPSIRGCVVDFSRF